MEESLGVLLITLGFWVAYCGVYGIPVWGTLVDIIKTPNNATKLIAEAKTRASISLADDGKTYVVENYAANPFVGKFSIGCGFDCHVKRNSGSPGIDYPMPVGTPLPAIWGGVVTNHANWGDSGNAVTIKRDNGDVYAYRHLSAFKVVSGTRVKPGTIVGLSGGAKGAPGAGNSTGPHLHFDYKVNGTKNVDPLKLLAGDRGRDGGGAF